MIKGAGIFRTQLPKGFMAGGIHCGVRQYRPDLGALISEAPCVATGVFTKNSCKAAPVQFCEQILPSTQVRAVITNSGEANAATGQQGIEDNDQMAACFAAALGCQPEQVLTASTGVIGVPLSIDKIMQGIPLLVNNMTHLAEKFAVAILTTDLVPKTVYKKIQLSHGEVCITGICKGSGMIHPNMATMLGYLMSDVEMSVEDSQQMLKAVCDDSFNMISVDGETSTNDCVLMLSNGLSGVSLVSAADKACFYEALLEVAITLAKSIVRDGEGASKFIQATVDGAGSVLQAKRLAKSLVTSVLIKTALYGESPNWGRILARIGMEGVSASLLKTCEIALQGMTLYAQGKPITSFDKETLMKQLKKDTVEINVLLSKEGYSATAWGCDLTEKYVQINAEYVT